MRAAGLYPIATILSSEAVLIQSIKPKNLDHLPLIKLVTSRIAGVLAASKYVLCTYNIERRLIEPAFKITPGRRAPTITTLDEEGWVAINVMVERSQLATVMDQLQEIGAHDILVTRLDNCRV
jgi:ATP phosphoribosyltransferase